ncbi:hypothetical protein BDC45DRAFT_87901 [Circinella umbellata]|nr:hypothetical protein BDC45DRAFT_87901 [Circinella umbellata]
MAFFYSLQGKRNHYQFCSFFFSAKSVGLVFFLNIMNFLFPCQLFNRSCLLLTVIL